MYFLSCVEIKTIIIIIIIIITSVQNTLQRSLRPHPHEYPAKEYVVSKNLRILVDSFAARGFGFRPTPKIPSAREKNLWYPG